MHSKWQDFLSSRGARFDDHDGIACVAGFEPAGQARAVEIADLSPLGLLRIEGPDAAKFLQGYATCDVFAAAPDRSLPGALCTREGRTIATFRLWGPPEALTLRLHRDLIVPVHDLLAQYIVFSKAELIEPGDSVIGLGVSGPDAERVVTELLGTAPQPGEVLEAPLGDGLCTAVRDRGDPVRIELWVGEIEAERLWDRIAEQARPVPWSRWLAHRIRAGFVELSPRTAGEFVPQALNLQAFDAINFDKGCYLGQEVVARMQYLGKLKKRLYRFSIEGRADDPPELGSAVQDGEKTVGEVVAAACDEGRCELLAVIRNDAAARPLTVGREVLTPQPLSYEIPSARREAG